MLLIKVFLCRRQSRSEPGEAGHTTTYLGWSLGRSRQNWLVVRRELVGREVSVVSRRRSWHHVTRVTTRVTWMTWMTWVATRMTRVAWVWPHPHDRGRYHGVGRRRTSHGMSVWWRLRHSSSLGCPGRSVRERRTHLLLQSPAGPAAAGRGAALRHHGLLPLPAPGAASLVLKVRVALWLGARVGHGVLVVVHVEVAPLVISGRVGLLGHHGCVLGGSDGGSLSSLVAEMSGQQEVLEVLVALLHPPPLGVGEHLAGLGPGHSLTGSPAVVVVFLGHTGLNIINNIDQSEY